MADNIFDNAFENNEIDPVKKTNFARVVAEILTELIETGMVPVVIVYGVPGTDAENPLKVKTAFDGMGSDFTIRIAKEKAIKALQDSL